MEPVSGRDHPWRVVYLAPCANEVVRRYLGRLRRLRDEGFEVHVFAGASAGIERLNEQGIIAEPIPVRRAHNLPGLVGAYFIVQARLLELRPALVHSFGHRLGWLGTLAAGQAEVPAVFATMAYHWLDEEPVRFPLGPVGLTGRGLPGALLQVERQINEVVGGPYRRTMRQAYRWLAKRVDRYLVTTEFDFQLVQDMELVPAEKLEMIIGGCGVDLEEYSVASRDDLDRAGARRALGLPVQWRQVVGWVGPVTRRHGADDLLAAISKLQMTHPSVGWVIVPRGHLAAGQAKRLKRLEDQGRVRVMERAESGADLYRAMDVLAWLARPSSPHDAIMEAAAMAVPTVGYDTPAARSLVEQGRTGHLVFDGDRQAALGTLSKLLNDPKRLEDLGWRARSRAQSRFSRRDVDDQVLRLYDLVLEETLAEASA